MLVWTVETFTAVILLNATSGLPNRDNVYTFSKLRPSLVELLACCSAHHWHSQLWFHGLGGPDIVVGSFCFSNVKHFSVRKSISFVGSENFYQFSSFWLCLCLEVSICNLYGAHIISYKRCMTFRSYRAVVLSPNWRCCTCPNWRCKEVGTCPNLYLLCQTHTQGYFPLLSISFSFLNFNG